MASIHVGTVTGTTLEGNHASLSIFLTDDERVVFRVTNPDLSISEVYVNADAFDQLEDAMDKFERSPEGSEWLSKYHFV